MGDAGGEESALEILPERSRAWWTSVLAGQVDASYPVRGTNIKARIDGDCLIVSGTVPSEEDRQEIIAESEHLKGHGINTVQNDLEVVAEAPDEPGLLTQTLVATFENAELAGFAQGYLGEHTRVRPKLMKLIAPEGDGDATKTLKTVLPEAFWDDAVKALEAGHALLIVTVDETEGFKTREILDEETRSLETLILPPEAAATTTSVQQELREVEQTSGESGQVEHAERGRRVATRLEDAVHEP